MFFDQIKDLDGNIKQLRDDLKNIASAADAHFDQLDDIAAHIIALEAIMAAMMKQIKVDPEEVRTWIKEMTDDGGDRPEGSSKARTIVDQLLETGKFQGIG
jgi:hypothetical protein